ncbi:MAG: gamma-glutamylcyclotransferase [Deltaproteobacteria bacterium]|nr:gamma-glutamylcyclotransferase [Deltaproteobacteria bacterium]
MNMNVFAYGSLMFSQVWQKVVGNAYAREVAWLYGYERRRIRGQSYPTIIAAPAASVVKGLLYLQVSQEDLQKLDTFEGEYYRRGRVHCVVRNGSKIPAVVYLFKKQYALLVEHELWDAAWFCQQDLARFLVEYEGLL